MGIFRESAYRARLEWGDGFSIEFTTNRDAGTADESAFFLTGLEGIYGGVGVEADNPKRSLGHGLFGGPVSRTGRALTLSAALWFKSPQDRDIADRYVSGILHGVEAGLLTYWVEDLELQTSVQLDGEVKHKAEGYEWIDLQVPLLAPDPFLYSPTQEATVYTPGMGVGLKWDTGPFKEGFLRWGTGPLQAACENSGNAEAWPRYRVVGDFTSGFRIVVNGRSLEYLDPVHARNPVTIDTGSGQVIVGRKDVTHRLAKREWEPIPALGRIVPSLLPRDRHSEGHAVVEWENTYI